MRINFTFCTCVTNSNNATSVFISNLKRKKQLSQSEFGEQFEPSYSASIIIQQAESGSQSLTYKPADRIPRPLIARWNY